MYILPHEFCHKCSVRGSGAQLGAEFKQQLELSTGLSISEAGLQSVALARVRPRCLVSMRYIVVRRGVYCTFRWRPRSLHTRWAQAHNSPLLPNSKVSSPRAMFLGASLVDDSELSFNMTDSLIRHGARLEGSPL